MAGDTRRTPQSLRVQPPPPLGPERESWGFKKKKEKNALLNSKLYLVARPETEHGTQEPSGYATGSPRRPEAPVGPAVKGSTGRSRGRAVTCPGRPAWGSQCACAAAGRGGACFRKGSCGWCVRAGYAVLLSAHRSVLLASPSRGAGEEVWASAGAAGGSREAKHLGQNTRRD